MSRYRLTDILLDFSYLIGETSVPSTGIDNRKLFAQRALEEAHRYADWDWAKADSTVTLPLSSGIASLPTVVAFSPDLDVRIIQSGTNNDKIFTQIPYSQQDDFGAGDYRYWLDGSQGNYVLHTSETSDSSSILTVRSPSAPINILDGTSYTHFPSSWVLAQGMLRFYRTADDPEYDVTQDDALFRRGLDDILSAEQRAKPIVAAWTIQDDPDVAATGEIG